MSSRSKTSTSWTGKRIWGFVPIANDLSSGKAGYVTNDAMFNCTCVEVDDEARIVETSYKIRTARIPHVCGECCDAIKPGRQYEIVTGRCDGRWFRCKTCLPCVGVRTDLMMCGWHYGFVWAEIHAANCLDEDDDFCMCPPKANLTSWY